MAFLYWSRQRRRVVICRVLACTLTLTLLCLVFFPFSVSVSAASVVAHGKREEEEWVEKSAGHEDVNMNLNVKRHEEYPRAVPARQERVMMMKEEEEEEDVGKEDVRKEDIRKEDIRKENTRKEDIRKEEEENIITAMKHISTLFPDELQLKGLLAPFSETGEAHIRDLGLRVRIFKKAFEAWEALHLVHHPHHRHHDDDASIHQQDVVQKLRQLDLPSDHLRRTIQTYDRFRSYVNKMAAHLFPWTGAYFPDHMSLHATLYTGGRGIVMTAGNDQAKFLLTSIPSFRKLGCRLPIEVLYLGDTDLDEEWRERLEAMPGVITRDLSHMIDDVGWTLKGWAAKPFAMLMSSFREALFIDADALFFVDPETLFEDPDYISTGALFFADRNLSPQNDKRAWLRQVLPKPISEQVQRTNRLWTGESVHMQDSGVLLVDKWRHFVAMLLTTRLNGPDRDASARNGNRGVYDMVYGDKETFWLSWELAQDGGYSFHDSVAGNMGVLEVEEKRERRKGEEEGEEEEEEEGRTTVEKKRERKGEEGGQEEEGEKEEEEEEEGETTPSLLTTSPLTPSQKSQLRKIRRLDPDISPTGSLDSKPDLPLTTINSPSTRTPSNLSTLCSPQLLHFDRSGKPLWWNGWIATSKFKEDHGKMQQFDVYVKEPRDVLKKPENKDRWDIRGSNVVCLRSDDVTEFTEQEQEILKMIREIAEGNNSLE